MGFQFTGEGAKPLEDAAIRAVFEKLATPGAEKRALLSLATGAEKIFLPPISCAASQMRQLRKALFICDRTELREQEAGALRTLFGPTARLDSIQETR
jgi:type I restriction enzyme R subunit